MNQQQTNYTQPKGISDENSETFSDFTMKSGMARTAIIDFYGTAGDPRHNSLPQNNAMEIMGEDGYISHGGSQQAFRDLLLVFPMVGTALLGLLLIRN